MNRVATQNDSDNQARATGRGESLQCPHCHQIIQIEQLRSNGWFQHNRVAAKNQDLRQKRARKGEVLTWQESDDAEPIFYKALTPRQVEVLRLVMRGWTNKEIAEHLIISVYTVQHHLANIYRRLGVSNRTQATDFAYKVELSAR